MSTTPLPCPFCGAQPSDYAIEPHEHVLKIGEWKMPDHPGSHVIECACGSGMIDTTIETVLARWNNRAFVTQAEARTAEGLIEACLEAMAEEAAPVVLPEPVATIYTMEALTPGGPVKYHAQVHKAVPAGTRLFAEPDVRALLAGVSTPTAQAAVIKWQSGAGLMWDVHAFGKWLLRVVSPLNWDAHSVHQELVRSGYAEHIDVRQIHSENTAAPQAPAADALDAARYTAFEAVRKKFCKLPRYSFLLDDKGNVRRVPDFSGNWVEFEAVHTLFEPEAIDAAIAAQATTKGGAA